MSIMFMLESGYSGAFSSTHKIVPFNSVTAPKIVRVLSFFPYSLDKKIDLLGVVFILATKTTDYFLCTSM